MNASIRACLLLCLATSLGCGDATGPGAADAAAADAAVSVDGPAADQGVDAPLMRPNDSFCRGLSECSGTDVCNFARGRCEARDVLPSPQRSVLALESDTVAPGDVLVVDGRHFFEDIFEPLSLSASIGTTQYGPDAVFVDENRAAIPIMSGVSGTITISTNLGSATSTDSVTEAQMGIRPCDGSTPAAARIAGATPLETGAFASAYVDISGGLRVHYPGACGGRRRTAIPGQYPLVMLLHGNGAIYLQYEYLAQHLASWGYVVAVPQSDVPAELQAIYQTLRQHDSGGGGLATLAMALEGVSLAPQVALIGHSRGAERLHDMLTDSAIAADVAASIYLAPVAGTIDVPGLFLVFSADKDLQAEEIFIDGIYAAQSSPKWKVDIRGGNHSLFTDHKVWLGPFADEAPQISRPEQMGVVLSFVLPLIQRAMAQAEPFAAQLDAPPNSALYSVSRAP